MSHDLTTIARPYAEAVFARALETDSLDQWEEVLEFLAVVIRDPALADIMANAAIEHDTKTDLLLDIGKELLNEENANFVRLLVENGRLSALPEIRTLFHQLRSAHQGIREVEVSSAYALDEDAKQILADALREKLGTDVEVVVTEDPSLIAGVKIRAGDMVIDGSVAGQLARLANELGT